MEQGFSEDVRDVMLRARDEAVRLGHDALRPEHLLLALARGGRGPIPRLLRDLGVDPKALRRTVEAALPAGPADEAEAVLEAAFDEAQRDGGEVGPEHLLLALLREPGPAADALAAELGLTYAAARAGFDCLLGREAPAPEPPERLEPRPAGQRLTIVFEADADEQAVADFLAALSALYRALGGDGLVILDAGVSAFDVEGEEPC